MNTAAPMRTGQGWRNSLLRRWRGGVAAEGQAAAAPLRFNRDFQLLWSGQVVSALGSRVTLIALPLLVLELTGSPARAGFVALANTLPLFVFALPAGVLLDRWNRKLVMMVADAARLLAVASVVLALPFHILSLAQLVAVAVVLGTGYIWFEIADRAALKLVVTPDQLPRAVAQYQARDYGASLAGQPLGGFLFGLGHAFPFLFDTISYAASLIGLSLIRTKLQEDGKPAPRVSLLGQVREGLSHLWHEPFLRSTSAAVALSDFTLNALFLVVIVAARQHGAAPAVIGAMFAFVGVGGLVGASLAGWLTRRLPARVVVIGALAIVAALVPLLAVIPNPLVLGFLYGAMFVPFPAWNVVIRTYVYSTVPNRLQARVQSVRTLLSLGATSVGLLAIGFVLEGAGVVAAVLVVLAAAVAAVVIAASSASIRSARQRLGAK
jgi:predicted MFS family arabinose efflux permease